VYQCVFLHHQKSPYLILSRKKAMDSLLKKAYDIAENEDVSTVVNGAVVYSVSYMPSHENKEQAVAFIKANPGAKMLDDTPCGKALINLGLDGKVNEVGEEITKIWRIASERYIKAASGNINAFVDGADERSTFCTTELAEIMQNPHITHINGIKKATFFQTFKPKHY
jgi:hypothetical protein